MALLIPTEKRMLLCTVSPRTSWTISIRIGSCERHFSVKGHVPVSLGGFLLFMMISVIAGAAQWRGYGPPTRRKMAELPTGCTQDIEHPDEAAFSRRARSRAERASDRDNRLYSLPTMKLCWAVIQVFGRPTKCRRVLIWSGDQNPVLAYVGKLNKQRGTQPSVSSVTLSLSCLPRTTCQPLALVRTYNFFAHISGLTEISLLQHLLWLVPKGGRKNTFLFPISWYRKIFWWSWFE